MKLDREDRGVSDAPLIGTLRFVFVIGLAFVLGWLGMFALLRSRW